MTQVAKAWLIMAVRLVRGLFFFGMAFCLFVAFGMMVSDPKPGAHPNGTLILWPLLGASVCWGAAFALKRWLNRAETETQPPGSDNKRPYKDGADRPSTPNSGG